MFTEFDEKLLQAATEAGFETPTPVQTAVFEPALDGDDLLVSAETGSGKTAAYLLPTFEHLLASKQGAIAALVLVPTRELAQQVLKQAKSLARYTDIKLGHIGGGTDIKKQNQLIDEPPHFLVATPGRLSELLARDLIDLGEVKILILDEADRLLDMGFADEIMAIVDHCSQRKQTQLYSASLANKGLNGLANTLMPSPNIITLNKLTDVHDGIQQQIIFADDKEHKTQITQWLLNNENYRHCLIFCNSKDVANWLCGVLIFQGINAGILHGDRNQKQRNLVMSKLRRDQIKVLVATDIAARGLDIDGMDLVINFDMPRRGEIYIHRIGRTGRAGDSGLAINLISAPEFNLMAGIERYLKQTFKRRKIKTLIGNYKGPKKTKASGKAIGSKKKKIKTKITKTKQRHRDKKKIGKRKTGD